MTKVEEIRKRQIELQENPQLQADMIVQKIENFILTHTETQFEVSDDVSEEVLKILESYGFKTEYAYVMTFENTEMISSRNCVLIKW